MEQILLLSSSDIFLNSVVCSIFNGISTSGVIVGCRKCNKCYLATEDPTSPTRREKHQLIRKPLKSGEGAEVSLKPKLPQNPVFQVLAPASVR